jgi:hypothetical protein
MRHVHRLYAFPLATALLALAPLPAGAWHGDGHAVLTDAAITAAGPNIPPFFAAQRDVIVHCSQDPDMFRAIPYPEIRAQEGPEHYMDVEMLKNAEMPTTRPEYATFCRETGVNPYTCGFLPYAIIEWTERLILAFAEYRLTPDDPAVPLKTAVYAGILAHYAADLEQPLHTTIHFDGRSGDGATSPRTGIHSSVDALAGKLDMPPDFATGYVCRAFTNFQAAVFSGLRLSHRHVETVYRLEPHIPKPSESTIADEELRAFIAERMRSASSFVADLFVTAWQKSEEVRLPPWRSPPVKHRAPGLPAGPVPGSGHSNPDMQ